MGGLRKRIPWTFWTYMAGTLALAGIFPFAGFWSKDEILLDASHFEATKWVYGLLVAAAILTAFLHGAAGVDGLLREAPHTMPQKRPRKAPGRSSCRWWPWLCWRPWAAS